MNPYVIFLLYMVAILGVVGFTLLLNHLLGPKPVPTAMKLEPFECGAPPVDPLNVKAVPIKYYAVAIVFILFELEGESCDSIAAGLGIPIGTVYSRLHKARKLFMEVHSRLLGAGPTPTTGPEGRKANSLMVTQ